MIEAVYWMLALLLLTVSLFVFVATWAVLLILGVVVKLTTVAGKVAKAKDLVGGITGSALKPEDDGGGRVL